MMDRGLVVRGTYNYERRMWERVCRCVELGVRAQARKGEREV